MTPTGTNYSFRYIKAGVWDSLQAHSKMPNNKTHQQLRGFSTDTLHELRPGRTPITRSGKDFQDHVKLPGRTDVLHHHDDGCRKTCGRRREIWPAKDEFTETAVGAPAYIREAGE